MGIVCIQRFQGWGAGLRAQVGALLPMLKRGVGVHHSGLLPILKEVIEILFQENLLKARRRHPARHPTHALPCSGDSWDCLRRAPGLFHTVW